MDVESDNFSAARQVDFNSFADPRLSEKNRREFIFHEIEAAAHDTEKFRVLAETISDFRTCRIDHARLQKKITQ